MRKSKIKNQKSKILEACYQITQPIFFVAPDINWALGLENYLLNYHIVCLDVHPMIDLLPKNVKVFCLKKEFPSLKCEKNTGAMLRFSEVRNYIEKQSRGAQSAVMYFKPQPMIDKVCKERGYSQIGNFAKQNRKWEDKFHLVKLGKVFKKLNLVVSRIQKLQEIVFDKQRMVIQLSRGWAGRNTFLVLSENDLIVLKSKYGNIEVKISPYVQGKTYLNNACITCDREVLQSQPAVQVNCLNKGFSSLPFSTCGRQWGNLDLEDEQIQEMERITGLVGGLMTKDGYRGYFGLDFIVEDGTGKVFLQEINARLTASNSFYTKLEIEAGRVPLLFFHLLSFVEFEKVSVKKELRGKETEKEDISGTQLILRNNSGKSIKIVEDLKSGVYVLDSGSFNFVRSSYEVMDLQNDDEYLIIAPGKGAVVSVESEVLRCESRKKLLRENGKVPSELTIALLKLKKFLV